MSTRGHHHGVDRGRIEGELRSLLRCLRRGDWRTEQGLKRRIRWRERGFEGEKDARARLQSDKMKVMLQVPAAQQSREADGDAGFIVVQSGERRQTPTRQCTGNDSTTQRPFPGQ